MDSTQSRIEAIVRQGAPRQVYFPCDFFDCGSEKAVSKALQRLVDAEVLMRMERGIYCKPGKSNWGLGPLPADADEVAEAIAKRDCIRLAPSFGEAQNILGLSEQVVMNPVFSTDGPSRKVKFHTGFKPIVFIHVSPKVFSFKNRIVMLTVIALTDIGKNDLWQFDLDGMKRIYSNIPYSEIREDLRIAPSWMRNVIMQMYEN